MSIKDIRSKRSWFVMTPIDTGLTLKDITVDFALSITPAASGLNWKVTSSSPIIFILSHCVSVSHCRSSSGSLKDHIQAYIHTDAKDCVNMHTNMYYIYILYPYKRHNKLQSYTLIHQHTYTHAQSKWYS